MEVTVKMTEVIENCADELVNLLSDHFKNAIVKTVTGCIHDGKVRAIDEQLMEERLLKNLTSGTKDLNNMSPMKVTKKSLRKIIIRAVEIGVESEGCY